MEDPIDQLMDLTNSRNALRDKLNKCQKDLEAIAAVVLEKFITSGTQSVNRRGQTVYLSRKFQCKAKLGVPYMDVAKRMMEEGYGEVCSISHPTMKALVKEMLEAGKELPAAVSELCDIQTIPSVSCIKSQ